MWIYCNYAYVANCNIPNLGFIPSLFDGYNDDGDGGYGGDGGDGGGDGGVGGIGGVGDGVGTGVGAGGDGRNGGDDDGDIGINQCHNKNKKQSHFWWMRYHQKWQISIYIWMLILFQHPNKFLLLLQLF